MPRCQECDDGTAGTPQAAHEDPRHPPLDTGDEVLCDDCYHAVVVERIDECERELDDLRNTLANLEQQTTP